MLNLIHLILDLGKLDLSDFTNQIQRSFAAEVATEEDVLNTIAHFHKEHGYILDPHTAVGVHCALKHQGEGIPTCCLSTAHPGKFGDTVEMAIGKSFELPASISSLLDKESRCETMDADEQQIRDFIQKHARHS